MTNDQITKLEKLANLRKEGVITEAEFNKEKAIILENATDPDLPPTNSIDTKEPPKTTAKGCLAFIVFFVFMAYMLKDCGSKTPVKEVQMADTLATKAVEVDTIRLKIDEISKEIANKNLKTLFTAKTDEFDKVTWYKPKTAPKSRNVNAVYCYFEKEGENASNLRFLAQHAARKSMTLLFLEFLIDGTRYRYIPYKIRRDSDLDSEVNSSVRWEWLDEPLRLSKTNTDYYSKNLNIILTASKAKTVKVKFVGEKYEDIKVLSKEEIKSFKTVLETYMALGGIID